MVQYRKAVLVALKDVEDALVRIEGDRRQLDELERAVTSAERAEEISLARHRGGLASLAGTLVARQRRLSLERRVIETRAALAHDTVGLVKALGGGWQEASQ